MKKWFKTIITKKRKRKTPTSVTRTKYIRVWESGFDEMIVSSKLHCPSRVKERKEEEGRL